MDISKITVQHLQKHLSPALLPVSCGYRQVMHLRRSFYKQQRLSSYRPPIPCISIGNIRWGGTGKTPLTSWLLQWAEQHHLHAAVLTRGYKGSPGQHPLLVTAKTSPALSGDEPLLMACMHPHAHIYAFPQRALAAKQALAEWPLDIFFLDDGMQHLAVQRDVDCVLLHPDDLLTQWDTVIPAGTWREGATALHAATAFFIKIAPEKTPSLSAAITQRLSTFNRPVFSFHLQCKQIVPLEQYTHRENMSCTAEDRPPMPFPTINEYILFSGVGEPAQVAETAQAALGTTALQHITFPDHHMYTEKDIYALKQLQRPLICTPKDAIKIAHWHDCFCQPVGVLQPELIFGPAWFTSNSFPEWWQQQWHQLLQHFAQNS